MVPTVYFFFPETAHRSLEEIDEIFLHANPKTPWDVVKVCISPPPFLFLVLGNSSLITFLVLLLFGGRSRTTYLDESTPTSKLTIPKQRMPTLFERGKSSTVKRDRRMRPSMSSITREGISRRRRKRRAGGVRFRLYTLDFCER